MEFATGKEVMCTIKGGAGVSKGKQVLPTSPESKGFLKWWEDIQKFLAFMKTAISTLWNLSIFFNESVYQILKHHEHPPRRGYPKVECVESRTPINRSIDTIANLHSFCCGIGAGGFSSFLLRLTACVLRVNLLMPESMWSGCRTLQSDRYSSQALGLQVGASAKELCVRNPAAARISHWSLVEDHSGPLPTAPCYGRGRAIKP